MDQVAVIRHKVLVEKQSARRVAREMGVSRNTVKRYLVQAEPKYGPREKSPAPAKEAVRARLEALLRESSTWTAGKQRLTATRLHRMLRDEGFRIGVTTVKTLVAEWRRQRREVFVPLEYAAGDLAQVDFFEVFIDVDGKRRKGWMFVMRLMHSGRDFARIYARQDQVAFLDGHVRAFEHFGAVPQRIAYDNLRVAVARRLADSERELTTRFAALSSHYLFEASFCRPATGHDKGGVEARGRGLRLAHLVPIPAEKTLDTINATLLQRIDDEARDRRDREGRSVVDRFSFERERMAVLPPARFDSAATMFLTATRRSLISVGGAAYSVPSRWAGLQLAVRVGADDVVIVGPDDVTVTHRRVDFGARSVDYRHFVRELATKPQAVRQVASSLTRDLGEPFPAAWSTLVDAHGPKQAARIFAKVLAHVEERGIGVVAKQIDEALATRTPLLLALAPPAQPSPTLESDALPSSLRGLVVDVASASDFDVVLVGGAA